MKANKLLKVLSAATIISTLAVVDYSTTAQNNNKVLLAADTQNPEVEVDSKLMHAYQQNKTSMGNAALVKTTVQKVNNGYKYKVIWKDITYGNDSGGIGRFWVNGEEITLKSIKLPGVLNPKEAEFTLSTLESKIPVEVFVEAMEKISKGNGQQNAFLQIETKGLEEKLTPKPVESPKPATSTPVKPDETVKPEETTKPTEPAKPTVKPETPKPTTPAKPAETKPTSSATATFYKGVKATLLNAYQPGRRSMGDVALEHNNVTVFKEGSTYHYIVRFHDLSTRGFTGGISKFWVNGTEYPVNSTHGANNQVEVHFTSSEKLSSVPVSVFVQVMEDIMPGGGKQDATLAFDWSKVTEQQGQPIAGGQPGSSAAGNGAGGLTPKAGRLNNGRLSNTGLETSSSILAGVLTLISAVLVGRRKQK